MQRVFLSFAVLAMLLNMAMATNYTVGAPSGGWDQSTALQTWASSLTFLVGDALIFQYTTNHDVVEVPQADYTSCQITNPIQTYTGGNTVIPLTASVKRYFVCGTAGHCASGMKVEIDVLAATSPSPSSPPANSPPSSPSASPAPSPSPKASSPAPADSPDNSPPSPTSPPSDSPASSPTTSPSPAGSAVPPPPPSSANKHSFKTSLAMGFGLVVMMVLTL